MLKEEDDVLEEWMMAYAAKQHNCLHSFLELVRPALERHEVAHNLPLGIVLAWEKGHSSLDEEPWLWTVHNDKDELLWVLLRTPPHFLIVCRVHGEPDGWNETDEAALEVAAEALKGAGCSPIPGVIGLKPAVDRFATLWRQGLALEADLGMQQRIYALTKLRAPGQRPEGQMIQASGKHIPLLTQWLQEFCDEALPDEPVKIDYPKTVMRLLDQGKLYLWVIDGEPKAMAAKSRPTRHGICIADVFTPKNLRGRGYASALVYDLSALLLKEYDFCSLYTDLANPTSNSIYQKIGYEPRYDSAVVRFIVVE